MADLAVCEFARKIVTNPEPKVGYGDIGDVLVRYLRGDITDVQAFEKMSLLDEDYRRQREREHAKRTVDLMRTKMRPTIAFMGVRAKPARVKDVLDLHGMRAAALHYRGIYAIDTDRGLDVLRGLHGPDQVWWVDWGATPAMRHFAELQQFKLAAVEECRAVIDSAIGEKP